MKRGWVLERDRELGVRGEVEVVDNGGRRERESMKFPRERFGGERGTWRVREISYGCWETRDESRNAVPYGCGPSLYKSIPYQHHFLFYIYITKSAKWERDGKKNKRGENTHIANAPPSQSPFAGHN